jgi:hypothetical protein
MAEGARSNATSIGQIEVATRVEVRVMGCGR